MKRLFKFLLPLLILALGVGGYLFLKRSKPEKEAIESTATLPVVAAERIVKSAISPSLTLFGQIEAPNNSVLSAGISADILQVKVLEGDAVNAGQLLLQLDQADIELDILQRRAELVEIEAQLESDRKKFESDKRALIREKELVALSNKAVERSRTLARNSAGTEATLDNALQQVQQLSLAVTQRELTISDFSSRQKLWQARLDRARAALSRAERDRQRAAVTAPFSGRIVDVMVSPGDRAGIATQLLRLYDDSALEIRAQVPSRYLPALQDALDKDQQIIATMRQQDRLIPLSLVRLSASVSRGQGGVDAFFRSGESRLPALGKTVEIRLALPPIADTVALSPDALYGASLVYRIEDGYLRAQPVRRRGQRIDAEGVAQMLVDGAVFEDGEQVLNSRLPQAIDGLQVTIGQQVE